jgi:murein DD-endopeptidase MepM/ murein hydrolase activator NlpD
MFFTGCNSVVLPTEKYYQFYSDSHVAVKNDTLYCSLNNPLDCPLRIYISTSDSILNKSLIYLYPIIIKPKTDTLLKIKIDSKSNKIRPFWRTALGDPDRKVVPDNISLPFCKGKSYKIIQGYNGKFSHNTDYSRYSLDFNLKSNDTICAVDDGFVVGVIKDYKAGGSDKRLKEFANFITLYHPQSGLYSQYVHLKHNGSLVKVGDFVKQGQAIGLAGLTGWTSIEHLHLNILVPVDNPDVFKSIPVEFIGHYRGTDLKRGDILKK